jgi:hypothetical protein
VATPVQVGSARWRAYLQFIDVCEKFRVIVVVVVVVVIIIITCRIGGLQVLSPVTTMHLIARR